MRASAPLPMPIGVCPSMRSTRTAICSACSLAARGAKNQELFAAPAHHPVVAAHCLVQSLGDLDQHLVARGMALRVVDVLGVVEVDQQQPAFKTTLAAQRRHHGVEVAAVCQVGHRVALALRLQLPAAGLEAQLGSAHAPVDDEREHAPEQHQRGQQSPNALQQIAVGERGGQALYVAKTVLLELEWVMRSAYARLPAKFASVSDHLLALPQITVEDRLSIEAALAGHRSGLDFADALHHATYRSCATARPTSTTEGSPAGTRLGLVPAVMAPR